MVRLEKGIYEQVVNNDLSKVMEEIKDLKTSEHQMDPAESSSILSRYIQKVLESGLIRIKEQSDEDSLDKQIELCNNLLLKISDSTDSPDLLNSIIEQPGKMLLDVHDDSVEGFRRPNTSISVSSLFTGGGKGLSFVNELQAEIESADEVCFLVSFIRFSGLRLIWDSLQKLVRNGGKLKVLTTTYMGVTEPEAIRKLSELGDSVEIKISYDARNTRLHAKSYIFKRKTGFNTLFIGSSNLSKAATTDGMEWNIKITNQDSPDIFKTALFTFNSYWDSSDFKRYENKDYEMLKEVLLYESKKEDKPFEQMIFFELKPFPYQQEILDQLEADRVIHQKDDEHKKNLVVAATGTGKTMIAAFDYSKFRERNRQHDRLLFIAHREEILKQSWKTFQVVLRDQGFGSMFVGSHNPYQDGRDVDHVFMSIQTFNSKNMIEKLSPEHYDYIVVDEVHHAAAESYTALLEYFKPKVLLGLTATPDRTDGKGIKQYFNDKITCEISLSDAINRELLSPFHYFAVSDPTDIEAVKFSFGRFDEDELSRKYVGNDVRVQCILDALDRYKPNNNEIRCIGFCVDKKHARYMADSFNSVGRKSIALTSDSSEEERNSAKTKLDSGDIQFIFVVDLYNEGVDIPNINTELLLRPTESKIVFVQQLGRGLRKAEGKSELTVLDFVGQFNKKYHVYEDKIRYLTSGKPGAVEDKIKGGFEGLPMGCFIKLEEQARDEILKNIDDSTSRKTIKGKVKEFVENTTVAPRLRKFIDDYHIDPKIIYKRGLTFTGMVKEINGGCIESDEQEKLYYNALSKICRADSIAWLESIKGMLDGNISHDETNERFAKMLFYTFYKKMSDEQRAGGYWAFVDSIKQSDYRNEILDLLELRKDEIDFLECDDDIGFESPLRVYCSYTKDQIFAALGLENRIGNHREGVLFDQNHGMDLLFVDLNKSEKDFSPTTMYDDYPINETLFHWQSQNKTTPESNTGRRYINHQRDGTKVLLFVRERKTDSYGMTNLYTYLGKVEHVSHEGSCPMSIVWRTEHQIPPHVLKWSVACKE